MNNFDLSDCEYIWEQMRYYSFQDFYEERKYIRKQYLQLPLSSKRMYMWYVYANTHMGINKKHAIWSYINGVIDDEHLLKEANTFLNENGVK